MSKQIADRPTEFCLSTCPYMALRVKSDIMYANEIPYIIENVMSCENEAVCKMWHDRGEPVKQTDELLTPEDLLIMSGERVWCVEKERYCIIELFEKEILACHEHSDLYFGVKGLTFYRHKPKGGRNDHCSL